MTREYRPIAGYPGYHIASDGTVWSSRYGKNGANAMRRLATHKRSKGNGYVTVTIRAGVNGKQKTMYVHHLVLEAFSGPRPDGYEGCHNDGDTSNNSIENLRWDLRETNLAERDIARGERRPESKLVESDVKRIRMLAAAGLKQRVIAQRFGIQRGTVSAVVLRKIWKHIP